MQWDTYGHMRSERDVPEAQAALAGVREGKSQGAVPVEEEAALAHGALDDWPSRARFLPTGLAFLPAYHPETSLEAEALHTGTEPFSHSPYVGKLGNCVSDAWQKTHI